MRARVRWTELDVVTKLQEFRAADPLYRDDSFDTISGWNAHGAIVHYRVNDKTNAKIVPPGLLLLDSGGQYVDGTTDITRTISIGEPTSEIRENFTLVLKGAYRRCHRAFSTRNDRAADRRSGAACIVAGGAGLRSWHRSWRRLLPVRA